MTTYALRRGTRRVLAWPMHSWLLLGCVLAWALLLYWNLLVGLPTSVQEALASVDPYLLLFLPPVVLILAAALSGAERGSPVRLAAGWSTLVAGAIGLAIFLLLNPWLAVAPPAIVAAAWVCTRYPTAAVGSAFLLTGTFNTIEAFTPVPAGPTVDLLLAGLWVATIWAYVCKGRDRPVWLWPGVAASLLYLFVSVLQISSSESLYAGLYAFRVTGWYMLAFILLAYSPVVRRHYRDIARCLVAAGILVGGYSLFRWFVTPSGQELEAALGGAPEYNFVGDELRLFGSLPSGHHLGGWTGVVLPFLLAFTLTNKGRWRLLGLAAFALCTFALLATKARTGVVGVSAGILVVLVLYQLSQGLRGPRVAVAAATIVIVGALGTGTFLLAIGTSSEATSRYSVLLTPKEDPSVQARFDKWRDAMREIERHPWGQGLGSAGEAHSRFGRFVTTASLELDNSYLMIAWEQGLVVMLLYIAAALLVLLGLARRAVVTTKSEKSALAIGACGTLTSFLLIDISAPFIQGLTALAAWTIVGIGVGQFTSPGEPRAQAQSTVL